jgi:hypothetical protein
MGDICKQDQIIVGQQAVINNESCSGDWHSKDPELALDSGFGLKKVKKDIKIRVVREVKRLRQWLSTTLEELGTRGGVQVQESPSIQQGW